MSLSPSGFAALGGDASSVQADRVHLNATVRTTQAQAYTVHELRSPSGVLVREYALPSGKIFGVAWQSPAPPDLRQLLGPYFDEFQQAAAQAQARRTAGGPLIIRHPGLVVELGGHMRAFRGRAYLPAELPQDVQQGDIH